MASGGNVIFDTDLGGSLKIVNGKLEVDLTGVLNVTKLPLYEYREIWAEESGATTANSAEWSFGNGAVGYIGIPIDMNWEMDQMYFMADTFAATARIEVALCDYTVPGNAASNVLTSIQLNGATDGFGNTNHAWKIRDDYMNAPVTLPQCVLGFRTLGQTGNISDARVGVRLKRKIDDYVSDVTLV